MNATRSLAIVLVVTTALAIGAPTQAAQAPTTIQPAGPAFAEYLQSCCSSCTESAEKLCGSGHVKNFDCGGFPCECSFDCDNNLLIPEALLHET